MDYDFKPEDLHIDSWPPPKNTHGMQTGRMPHGVKIIHLPTGTVVTCDNHRNQHVNRELALKDLWDQVKGKPTYNELATYVGMLRSVFSNYLSSVGGGVKFCGHEFNCICPQELARKVLSESPEKAIKDGTYQIKRNSFIEGANWCESNLNVNQTALDCAAYAHATDGILFDQLWPTDSDRLVPKKMAEWMHVFDPTKKVYPQFFKVAIPEHGTPALTFMYNFLFDVVVAAWWGSESRPYGVHSCPKERQDGFMYCFQRKLGSAYVVTSDSSAVNTIDFNGVEWVEINYMKDLGK